MHRRGVRALRLDLFLRAGLPIEQIVGYIERSATRVKKLGWHLQFLLDARDLPVLAPRIEKLPVPVVIDHMGHFPASGGLQEPGFATLLSLVRDGAWVKTAGCAGAARTSTSPSTTGSRFTGT